MTHAGHKETRCLTHEKVLAQCRCAMPDKMKIYIECPGYPTCYTPLPPPVLEEGGHCQACGNSYVDVYWLPDAWWIQITPKPENPGAGLLCPDCALARLKKL